MINIEINKNIIISGLSKNYSDRIKKTLTIPNILYHKMIRMGIRCYNRDWKFYKETKNGLIIPRGMKKRIIVWLDKCGLEYNIIENYIEKKIET